jgi:hypothetical protein
MAPRNETKRERRQAKADTQARAERKQARAGTRKKAERKQAKADTQARTGRKTPARKGPRAPGDDASPAERIEWRLARIEEAMATESERSEELLERLDAMLGDAPKSAM